MQESLHCPAQRQGHGALVKPLVPSLAPGWTAPLEPSSVSRIAVSVKTSGEMDPIQLAWMVNQMER